MRIFLLFTDRIVFVGIVNQLREGEFQRCVEWNDECVKVIKLILIGGRGVEWVGIGTAHEWRSCYINW